jgi:hypothetical protein
LSVYITGMLTKPTTAIVVLILSIAVFGFYLSNMLLTDVYRYAAVGAIYETLAIPMLGALLLIPIMSILIFIKNNGKSRLYSLLSALFIISAILVIAST